MKFIKTLLIPILLVTVSSCEDADESKFYVVQFFPEHEAIDISLDTVVEVIFSMELDQSALEEAIIVSSDKGQLDGTISYNSEEFKLIFTPSSTFEYKVEYTVELSKTIKDQFKDEQPLTTWSFTTIEETSPAKYSVTFDATWSSTTHPTDFPSNPHFSGLIGMTHNGSISLFEVGELATTGIKNMAETGSKDNLTVEIEQQISDGSSQFLISGGGIALSPGSVSTEFEINFSHPIVSLVSMIAPSPDWFVSVNDLSLHVDGKWVDELTVSTNTYDSGTDNGLTFNSSNEATDPAVNIFAITEAPLGVNGTVSPLGSMIFKRID